MIVSDAKRFTSPHPKLKIKQVLGLGIRSIKGKQIGKDVGIALLRFIMQKHLGVYHESVAQKVNLGNVSNGPTCAPSSKANAVHGGVLCQKVTNLTALSSDQVDEARREARLVEYLGWPKAYVYVYTAMYIRQV
jgi:hypothetical protein